MAVAHAAPATPIPREKIKIGSKIILSTVPNAAMAMGNFVSPSPTKMALKNVENTINGKPKQMIRK